MKCLAILFVIFWGCAVKHKAPDQRDRVIEATHVDIDFSKNLQNWSFQRLYVEDGINPNEYMAELTDSVYQITDTSGVLAERVKGKWRIINCQRALEAIFTLDSTLQRQSEEWEKESKPKTEINLHNSSYKQ